MLKQGKMINLLKHRIGIDREETPAWSLCTKQLLSSVLCLYCMNYSERLQSSSRWKRKAREVRERDGVSCTMCHNNHGILCVHHIVYSVKNPVEEPNENLITLCIDCHQWVHSYQSSTGLNFYRDDWVGSYS